MVHHVLPAGAHILRAEDRACHGEPRTESDDEKGDRKADGHRRHRRRTQAADPECVSQLVAGLQRISQDDRNCEPEERRRNRSLQQHSTPVSHECFFNWETWRVVEDCSRLKGRSKSAIDRADAQWLTTNQGIFVDLGADMDCLGLCRFS